MKIVAGGVAHFRGLLSKRSIRTWQRFTNRRLRLGLVHEQLLCSKVSWKWATGETFLLSSHSWSRDSVRSVAGGPRRKRTSVVLKWFHLEIEVSQVLKKPRGVQDPSCLKFQQSDGWFGAPCHLLVYGWLCPQSREPSNSFCLFCFFYNFCNSLQWQRQWQSGFKQMFGSGSDRAASVTAS